MTTVQPSPIALIGARIFDGEGFRDDHAVILDGPRIAAVVPAADVPAAVRRDRLDGLLAPGFIDVQVNGGGGVLFNDARTPEGIAAIGRAHRAYGTTGYLPAFITDTRERMAEAIAAARAAIEAGVPGVLGIHLEGPFLNPARAGAHDRAMVRPWDEADLARLASLGQGVTLLTLAPEVVPPDAIARLRAAGVIIAAGHTEATPDVIAEARAAGLTGFTHLFNAMPPLAGRAPGPVGAALADRDAFASIIADLHHVAPVALRAALAARGPARTLLVTDAMPTVGTDRDTFSLQGRPIRRRGGRLETEEGRLAGSDLDMATAVRNATGALGLPLAVALQMASRVPAAFLGIARDYGRIAPGSRTSLVLLDDTLRATRTWIDGSGG